MHLLRFWQGRLLRHYGPEQIPELGPVLKFAREFWQLDSGERLALQRRLGFRRLALVRARATGSAISSSSSAARCWRYAASAMKSPVRYSCFASSAACSSRKRPCCASNRFHFASRRDKDDWTRPTVTLVAPAFLRLSYVREMRPYNSCYALINCSIFPGHPAREHRSAVKKNAPYSPRPAQSAIRLEGPENVKNQQWYGSDRSKAVELTQLFHSTKVYLVGVYTLTNTLRTAISCVEDEWWVTTHIYCRQPRASHLKTLRQTGFRRSARLVLLLRFSRSFRVISGGMLYYFMLSSITMWTLPEDRRSMRWFGPLSFSTPAAFNLIGWATCSSHRVAPRCSSLRHWQTALRARPVALTCASFDRPFCFLNTYKCSKLRA